MIRNPLLLGLLAISAALIPAQAQAQDVLISRVAVIDVDSGKAIPDQDVAISGQVISAVGPARDEPPAEGVTVIDGRGRFLIPGLMDSHVHWVHGETFGPLMIANGVTSVREMGNATSMILAVRDQLNDGTTLGPGMIVSGAIVDGKPPVWPFSEACATPEEGRAAVRKLAGAGVDFIKVYSRLGKDTYLAVVDEAKAAGIPVMGHIPERLTLDDAMAAGQVTNEHLNRFDELIGRFIPTPTAPQPGLMPNSGNWLQWAAVDKARLRTWLAGLAKSGMVQCPTLVVMEGIGRIGHPDGDKHPHDGYTAPLLRAMWRPEAYAAFGRHARSAFPAMKELVGELARAGVPLICGTDLANPNVIAGFSLHDEMVHFQEAGIAAPDVLRAATVRPARTFGLADRQGQIAVGMLASLVLLNANPLDDIAHASRIHAVLLRGRVFDRLALDELLAKAQRAAGEAATEDEKPVDMDDLPGEIVHRGTYKSKFMTFDAGTESFAISKSADGWHMKVDSHPLGGGVRPAVVTTSTGTDFTFRRATWTTKGGAPLTATYERDGDKLRARSVQGEEREEQLVDAPEPAVVTSQAFASDFFTYRRLALEPGSKKTVTAANFGVAGWKLEVSEATYERLPDDAFTYRGAEVNAEVYTASLTTPMGTMRQKTWVGPDGLVLKTTMATPMGSLQTVLQ